MHEACSTLQRYINTNARSEDAALRRGGAGLVEGEPRGKGDGDAFGATEAREHFLHEPATRGICGARHLRCTTRCKQLSTSNGCTRHMPLTKKNCSKLGASLPLSDLAHRRTGAHRMSSATSRPSLRGAPGSATSSFHRSDSGAPPRTAPRSTETCPLVTVNEYGADAALLPPPSPPSASTPPASLPSTPAAAPSVCSLWYWRSHGAAATGQFGACEDPKPPWARAHDHECTQSTTNTHRPQ